MGVSCRHPVRQRCAAGSAVPGPLSGMEERQIRLVAVTAGAPMPRDLLQQAEPHELLYQLTGRDVNAFQPLFHYRDRNQWLLEEEVKQRQREGISSEFGTNDSAVLFAHLQNRLCCLGGFPADLPHSSHEELQPALPVTAVADRHEAVVVLGPVRPEKMAQIQERPLEDASLAKEKRDQQASYAPIAVEKRVDGFELCMCQPAVEQGGQGLLVVQ